MTQGLGVAVSCLRAEAEEGGDGAVCYGRCTRETDGGVKRSRGKHFHLPSNLEFATAHETCWAQSEYGPCPRSLFNSMYPITAPHIFSATSPRNLSFHSLKLPYLNVIRIIIFL